MAESGHARNVEHFTQLISFVQGYGAAYNPNNQLITLPNLQAKLASARASVDGVSSALAPWKMKVNDRENEYSGIKKLATRVVNSYAASGADDNAVADAKGFKRKIDGARAKTVTPPDPENADPQSRTNSVSQQSFSQVAEHFGNLIALVSNDSHYKPNENDLQTAQLQAKTAAIKTANDEVLNAAVPLSNARLARNAELYEDKTGIVDIAALVKKYVKSVFGADSPEFRQISGLEFKKQKK